MRRMIRQIRCAALAALLIGAPQPLRAQLIGDIRSAGAETAAGDERADDERADDERADDERAGDERAGDEGRGGQASFALKALLGAACTSHHAPDGHGPNNADSPEEFQDPAFDKHVDLRLFAEACESLAPASLADVAMQFTEGERVLRRSHQAFKAGDVIQLAARAAWEDRDQASLRRLTEAAKRIANQDLVARLSRLQERTADGPSVENDLKVPIDSLAADQYADLHKFIRDIRRARIMGDTAALDSLRKTIPELCGLTETQKDALAKSTFVAADQGEVLADGILRKLDSVSRGDEALQIAGFVADTIRRYAEMKCHAGGMGGGMMPGGSMGGGGMPGGGMPGGGMPGGGMPGGGMPGGGMPGGVMPGGGMPGGGMPGGGMPGGGMPGGGMGGGGMGGGGMPGGGMPGGGMPGGGMPGGGMPGGGMPGGGMPGGGMPGGGMGGGGMGGGQVLMVPIMGAWRLGNQVFIIGLGDSEIDGEWISGPLVSASTGYRNRYMWKASSMKDGYLYIETQYGRQGPFGVRLISPTQMTWLFGAHQVALHRIN